MFIHIRQDGRAAGRRPCRVQSGARVRDNDAGLPGRLGPEDEDAAADCRFTHSLKVGAAAGESVRTREGGTHAGEIETSMMLDVDPSLVDMRKAVKDYHPSGAGGLTRDRPSE